MANQPRVLHTFEQYLELERKAEYRSEYHGGEIYAMAGGTEPHSRLSARMCGVLDRYFDSCRIYESNLKLYVLKADRCVYPDAMLLCGEPVYYQDHRDVIMNPSLVVEVLSPSTMDYDKEAKSGYYRGISSVKDILLISQDEVFIEHFALQENDTWTITPYVDRTGSIALRTVELPIEEIYRGIL